MMANIVDALIERGHDVTVLTSYAPAKTDNPKLNLIIRDIGVYERHAEGCEVIEEEFNKCDPDLVLSHHFFVGEFKDWFSALPVPFVELIHNRERHPAAALAIFNSMYTAVRKGFDPARDMVMLPPVGRNTIRKRSTDDCIGHIKPLGGKGIELTYRMAATFPERKFLILRGEWQDGEIIQHRPNVEFMEPVNDIRDFYSRCEIVVMPSLSEDAGTVPQECAANGIPCISSNVMGLPETNGGGIVLAPDDDREWAKAILELDNPEYYRWIVDRQAAYIRSWGIPEAYDAIDFRIRSIVREGLHAR